MTCSCLSGNNVFAIQPYIYKNQTYHSLLDLLPKSSSAPNHFNCHQVGSSISHTLAQGTGLPLAKMASSDLDQLIDMGFDKERAELSLQKGRSCTQFASSRKTSCAAC
jgi:hypothetical protein